MIRNPISSEERLRNRVEDLEVRVKGLRGLVLALYSSRAVEDLEERVAEHDERLIAYAQSLNEHEESIEQLFDAVN